MADNTVAPATDALVLMEARGKTVVLPDAHGKAGLSCTVKNTASGGQTVIAAHGDQPIEGQHACTIKLVPALAFARLECDGVGWWVSAQG